MTQPRLAQSTPTGRMYARREGGDLEVPSITTIIGCEANDLGGWYGYSAAQALATDPQLPEALRDSRRRRALVNHAAKAAERHRDQAAQRGDRVHDYCEQLALRAMGCEHDVERARADLEEHHEARFADSADQWWELYRPEPLAAEITVWNSTVGYAGTLDLVARIGGKVCLIDYKTKGTDRTGRVKAPDPKVVTQLVAGLKAEESLVDAATGQWEPWPYGDAEVLMAVAIGETEALSVQAVGEHLPAHWYKFCALAKVWARAAQLEAAGPQLRSIVPPPLEGRPTGRGSAPVGTAARTVAGPAVD
ncbi:cytochrome [Kocuria rhizophila]|uniref:cytochrome n=1 Tax=Kocuria rhizophila TaxID=72000 RepID=UPI00190B6571|nr:cytochrome [Kocuria rhizophila]MBK4120029.1 cytochrome [Kocuria rhizophila]